MQLRTPKRYTVKGSRRPLINLKWLWLYLTAPILILIAVLVWDYRQPIGDVVGQWTDKNVKISLPTTPTPAPTPADPGEVSKALTTGRVNRAVDVLENLSDATPNLAKLPALAAQLLVLRANGTSKDNLARATHFAQKAITGQPESFDGWISEALVLDWSKQPKAALGYALRAKDLSPNDPMVLTVLGEIYHDLEKDDQATKLLNSAIDAAKKASPVDAAALTHAYYVRALLYDAANDNKSAVAAMLEAWKFAQSDLTVPSSYVTQWLGAYYLSQQQADKAVQMLSDGIKRDQDDPILQWQLGMVYVNSGDQNKARTYFETCRNLDPLQPKCLKRLAQLYYYEQNYQLAVETIQTVIDQNSHDPKDYEMSALGYRGLNQCDKALIALNTGLQYIDPSDANTKTDYADLLHSCGQNIALDTPAATEASVGPTPTLTPTPKKK